MKNKTVKQLSTERKKLRNAEIQLERMGKLPDNLRLEFNRLKDEITWHIETKLRTAKTKATYPIYPIMPNENLEIIKY